MAEPQPVGAAGEEHRLCRAVAVQPARPELLHTVDHADDAAVVTLVGVFPRTALGRQVRLRLTQVEIRCGSRAAGDELKTFFGQVQQGYRRAAEMGKALLVQRIEHEH